MGSFFFLIDDYCSNRDDFLCMVARADNIRPYIENAYILLITVLF